MDISPCYRHTAPLERRLKEKHAGNYEVEQDTEYINRGGNKGTRRNGGINPKSLKEHRNDCANRSSDNHINCRDPRSPLEKAL